MLFQIALRLSPLTMLVAVMAPGFTSGFISAPLYCSMATMELNAWPVASTPIVLLDRVWPALIHYHRKREDFRDGLDRDFRLHIACGVDAAVCR